MSVLTGSVAGSSSRLAGGLLAPAPKMVSDVASMTIRQSVPGLNMRVGKFRRSVWGFTKDSVGAILGTCTVDLFRTSDDVKLDSCVSATNGYYEVSAYADDTMYIVAYKAGAPDVAGTTVNTLVGM